MFRRAAFINIFKQRKKIYITSTVAFEKVSIFSLSVDMRRINRSVWISLCSSIRSFIHLLNYSSNPLFINLFILYSFTQFTIVAKITAWTQTAKPLLAKSCLTSWVAWARITGTKILKKEKKKRKRKDKIKNNNNLQAVSVSSTLLSLWFKIKRD